MVEYCFLLGSFYLNKMFVFLTIWSFLIFIVLNIGVPFSADESHGQTYFK